MPSSDSLNEVANKNFRGFEKPIGNEWITSGELGSRDAVLLFRTDILNTRNKKALTAVASISAVAQSSHHHSQLVNAENTLFDYNINSSCGSTFNLDSSIAASKLPLNKSFNAITKAHSIENIQQNLSNVKTNDIMLPLLTLGHKQIRDQNFCKTTKKNCVNESVLRYKNCLHISLSSSDNSISSDCDDCHETERITDKFQINILRIAQDRSGEVDKLYNAIRQKGRNEFDRDEYDDNCNDVAFQSNMPATKLKITYKFMQTETKLLRKIFIRHGLSEVVGDENFSILWTGVHMKPDILRNLSPYQRVNHFPRSYELTRKDRLYKNIERMQHLRGLKHFDIVPQSFILPLEYRDLVSAHNKHRGPWIVKPAASSRGRGIFIVNSPDQISQDEQVLVSKYVADPLCIDGHKCDLRVYVLVTSFDPLIIYIYEEGLVRLATVKYDRNAENLWNPCMHLCNYSINKYHSDYIKSRDAHDEDVGHKWTLSALLRHLKSQGCDTRQLMLSIEDLIIKSLLSCAQSIISACRMFVPNGNNCFELYGFDILITSSLKPWLLEINLSPSIGVDTPLDVKVKACLIVDLLTCIGIPAYSPEMRSHFDRKWTRFRAVNYARRTNSADLTATKNTGPRRSALPTTPALTIEEKRIIRNARLQNTRRGGFVRIFPTEDSMQRYGTFLDSATGIPLSTPIMQGQVSYSMILPHNYNQILFNNLYGKESRDHGSHEGNTLDDRINQYERALETAAMIMFNKKQIGMKCVEEGFRLRNQVLNMIDNGLELTQLQARQTFALYLEAILRRLTEDPRDYYEKLIIKFLNRMGCTIKAPVVFRNLQNNRVINKARTAMIAKLLSDFLEQYNRDTEAYVDTFDHIGMIPSDFYNEFLSQAQESDFASVLSLHTNLTSSMPFLYNRCGLAVPPTPPIPSGPHGFLKALPAMVISGSGARDFNKHDSYYKMSDRDMTGLKNEKLYDVATNKKSSPKR